MERFIRDKYERKKYCASQPPALRDASILGLGGAAPQQVLPIDYSFDLSKDFAIHVLKVLLVWLFLNSSLGTGKKSGTGDSTSTETKRN